MPALRNFEKFIDIIHKQDLSYDEIESVTQKLQLGHWLEDA